jgi:hypothetical protein
MSFGDPVEKARTGATPTSPVRHVHWEPKNDPLRMNCSRMR